ncbi:polysaccharide biosynthesis protein [Candidatus Poribacteria bacterium]|nr:polysaccharide biosynthesis protein [Candidatus Poribacteria bacterium]MYA58430.1 polysaccharide biosynthesis protein [Candidatus Poribacteria bacterium]
MDKPKIKWSFTIVVDVLLVNLAFLFAYLTGKQLGFDFLEQATGLSTILQSADISPFQPQHITGFGIAAAVTIVRVGLLLAFNLYKPIWQYATAKEFRALATAIIVATVGLIGLSMLLKIAWILFLIDGFYNFALIGFTKFSAQIFQRDKGTIHRRPQSNKRAIGLHAESQPSMQKPPTKVLIVGAGETGIGVLRALRNHPEKGYVPVGFIDDAPHKVGRSVAGLEVLGTTRDLTYIARKREIDEVVIAIPSAPGGKIRDIIRQCEYRDCQFKIVPNIHAILEGRASVSQIREVRFEDLLKRSTSQMDLAEVSKYLSGKRVMVTGAGGSIGSELCRQVAKLDPELLILFGRGENSLYHTDIELREFEPYLNRALVIGDIRDNAKVSQVTRKYRPDIIFHAAAHKHVKFMENHPDEAVKNNILGTQNLINTAIEHEVEAFILVSSDKAVNPTSVYGASKRVTEKLVQCKAKQNRTRFIAVRFGNVIGSRASVIPNFKRQIAKGGPVTVTHREATRYFMTIPEAVQLLIQAGAMGNDGEILMLDMGDPIKILDLAQDLIRLSGLEVDTDIKIEFTGLEPGEKLYEELLTPQEGVTATKHQRIFVAQLEQIAERQLLAQIEELSQLADALDSEGIVTKFQELVPTYQPNRAFLTEDDADGASEIIQFPTETETVRASRR